MSTPSPPAEGTARNIKSGIEQFRLGDRPDVAVLYPDVCFASLDAVGDMPVRLLVDAVLQGWRREDRLTAAADGGTQGAPFPVATLVVSSDRHSTFHPELSNREPVEIQVWADGRVTVEIEFQGVDVTLAARSWSETARRVLDSWAGSFGLHLLDVFNDRARSLPDVWNATFEATDGGQRVVDLVRLGERALRTVELSMTGWGVETALRRLLTDGDVHAVLAWQPSAVLEFWPSPPEPEEVDLFAADVCALANSVRGGAVIVGVRRGTHGPVLAPFEPGDHATEVAQLVARRIHPVPERLDVRFLPVSGGLSEELPTAAQPRDGDAGVDDRPGILVFRVPPQDDLLRPFLLHDDTSTAEGNLVRLVGLVEREGSETISRSVSAVHTALAAGMALLRRQTDDD